MNKKEIVLDYLLNNNCDLDIIPLLLNIRDGVANKQIYIDSLYYGLMSQGERYWLRIKYKGSSSNYKLILIDNDIIEKLYPIITYKHRKKIISEL